MRQLLLLALTAACLSGCPNTTSLTTVKDVRLLASDGKGVWIVRRVDHHFAKDQNDGSKTRLKRVDRVLFYCAPSPGGHPRCWTADYFHKQVVWPPKGLFNRPTPTVVKDALKVPSNPR